jgi:hypothetical protein
MAGQSDTVEVHDDRLWLYLFEALSGRPTNCKYRSHRYHIIQWVNTYHVGQQEFREISLASVSNPFTRLSMIQATSYMYTYHGIT